MKNAILNALNIRKGEETAIVLLLLYSFVMGSVIAFFYTSATSLFVVSFESSVLPYAYIGGGIMSYLVWLLYARIERFVSFQKLTLLGIFLLLISVGFFMVGIHYLNGKWIPFLMFVWIRVFIFISVVGFWGLAAKMFDLRQGKRIFGLIGSGEVISDIVGFFSIPLVLHFIATKDLLYISFIGLVICLFLMAYMFKRFTKTLSMSEPGAVKKMNTSFKGIFKNRYLTILILTALFPMFGMCFADFSFLHQIKIEFKNQEFLASFLSIFFGATAVAEFILKSFFSGRLMEKYGLKVALPVLPAVMIGCVFLAVSSGVFYGTTGLFFSFIALTKMVDRVLRSAIYDPSYQILYQPLPAEDRLNAQGMVEGMAKGLGFALAGAVVLFFTLVKALNLVHFNILFLFILALWLKMGLTMYHEYRHSLGKVLSSKHNKSSDPENHKSNLRALSTVIVDGKETNLGLIMNILSYVEPQKVHRFLNQIITSSSVVFQEKILEQISVRRIFSAEQMIKDQLNKNPDLTGKKLFESTLYDLVQAKKTDFDTLLALSQSKDSKKRTFAANLLPFTASYKVSKILQTLLQDENPETRKAALVSSGQIGKRELWPFIINNLFQPNYSTQAISAIKMIGDPILSELDNYFDKSTTTKEVRLKIIGIYANVRGDKALNLLRARIQYPDESIRNHVFKALTRLEYHAKYMDISRIKETIEEEIAITVWVMASMLDIQMEKNMPLLREALQGELKQKKDNVFLLLSMLYDSKTIRYIQESFQTGTHESKVYATEILDLTVSSDIKEIFLPLLEDLSVEDSLRLYKDKYPQQKMTVFERLKDIINKDYLKINRWTKACAIFQLSEYQENEMILLSNFLNPDPFIMQNSVKLLKGRNSERFRVIYSKLETDKVNFIDKYSIQDDADFPQFSLFEKVDLLRKNQLFSAFSTPDIARVIENSTEIVLNSGEEFNQLNMQDSIIYVLSGEIDQISNKKRIRRLFENEFYWSIINTGEEKVTLKSESRAIVLVLSPELIFNTMSDNSEYTLEVLGILSKTA